jgi:hypothetical protein
MNRLFKLFVATTIAALTIGACIAVNPTAPAVVATIPEVTIMASEYAFEVPKAIEAGLVRIKFHDHGQEVHHVQFVRLNDGVTFEQFTAAMQKGEAEAMSLITFPGGVALIDPGSNASAVINLIAGDYVLLCFVPAPDGVPHVVKGMIASFKVVAGKPNAPEPQADAEVTLLDFSFILPSDIKAGKQIWKVINNGPQLHEINLMKLAEGKTLEDVTTWMQKPAGAPPFANVGGYGALDAKTVGWMDLDLTPGEYVAICHVPDPASGKLHEMLGMVRAFTVQ